MHVIFTSTNQSWVWRDCDSCTGTLFGWHNAPQCTRQGCSSRILLPFVLCKDLCLSLEKLTWFSQHDGLAHSSSPSDHPTRPVTLCESAGSLWGQGNNSTSSLKPACAVSDTSSPYARSAWVFQAIKIFQDSHVLDSLSLLSEPGKPPNFLSIKYFTRLMHS